MTDEWFRRVSGEDVRRVSSHATQGSNQLPVNEKELAAALTIIVGHLQNTIYNAAGLRIRNYVLRDQG